MVIHVQIKYWLYFVLIVLRQKVFNIYGVCAGHFNMKIFNAMRRMNLKMGLWSLNTADYLGKSPEEIVRLVLSSVRAGDIILMHSGIENTVEALPKVIEGLKARGFNFVRLDELQSFGRI